MIDVTCITLLWKKLELLSNKSNNKIDEFINLTYTLTVFWHLYHGTSQAFQQREITPMLCNPLGVSCVTAAEADSIQIVSE